MRLTTLFTTLAITLSGCALTDEGLDDEAALTQDLYVCNLVTGWTNNVGGGYFIGRPSGGGKTLYVNPDSNGDFGFMPTGTQVAVQRGCTVNDFLHVFVHLPVGPRSGWIWLQGLRHSGKAFIFD